MTREKINLNFQKYTPKRIEILKKISQSQQHHISIRDSKT